MELPAPQDRADDQPDCVSEKLSLAVLVRVLLAIRHHECRASLDDLKRMPQLFNLRAFQRETELLALGVTGKHRCNLQHTH